MAKRKRQHEEITEDIEHESSLNLVDFLNLPVDKQWDINNGFEVDDSDQTLEVPTHYWNISENAVDVKRMKSEHKIDQISNLKNTISRLRKTNRKQTNRVQEMFDIFKKLKIQYQKELAELRAKKSKNKYRDRYEDLEEENDICYTTGLLRAYKHAQKLTDSIWKNTPLKKSIDVFQ